MLASGTRLQLLSSFRPAQASALSGILSLGSLSVCVRSRLCLLNDAAINCLLICHWTISTLITEDVAVVSAGEFCGFMVTLIRPTAQMHIHTHTRLHKVNIRTLPLDLSRIFFKSSFSPPGLILDKWLGFSKLAWLTIRWRCPFDPQLTWFFWDTTPHVVVLVVIYISYRNHSNQ